MCGIFGIPALNLRGSQQRMRMTGGGLFGMDLFLVIVNSSQDSS